MPNPLANTKHNSNKSKAKREGHPDALRPMVELVAHQEYVNPYRGMETHGVEPTGRYDPVDEWNGEADEDYDKADKEPADPIAVKIVNNSPKEDKRFRVSVTYAKPEGSLIVNRNENRSKVTVRNTGDMSIYLSERQDLATSLSGWEIKSGAEISMTTDQEIYAGTDSQNVARVMVLTEYAG